MMEKSWRSGGAEKGTFLESHREEPFRVTWKDLESGPTLTVPPEEIGESKQRGFRPPVLTLDR